MKKLSGIVGAILFLLGGILLLAGRSFVIPAFSRPVDIMEEGLSAASANTAVETELFMVLDRFSRRENRDYHMTAVWKNAENEEIFLVPVSISSGSAGNYSNIVEESMDYMYGDANDLGTMTVPFQGVVLQVDDETKKKMTDWLLEVGLVEQASELEEITLPYMLYSVNLDGIRQNTLIFGGMTLVGLVLLCIGIFAPDKASASSVYLELKETKIGGITYPLEQLKALNDIIIKGNKQEAHNILARDFHVEPDYASFVVENWSEYYY
ncbi:MAG: hypothetical protein HFH79_09165 [Lachnospiraceae bacterium]|nr:hypothetical protein [Lachnospiraceae bacterium]